MKLKQNSLIKKSSSFKYYFRAYILLFFSLLAVTSFSVGSKGTIADNLYGDRCGPDKVCSGTQTCQIQYNGKAVGDLPGQTVLNIDQTTQNPVTNITYECIDSPQLTSPNSPYKGDSSNGYNDSNPNPDDPGVPVNIINQSPVPIDLFNPLPLPTTIVSPTPLPVIVVDDLALYRQTKIDEYVTEQTVNQALQQTGEMVRAQANELVATRATNVSRSIDSAKKAATAVATEQIAINTAPTSSFIKLIDNLSKEQYESNGGLNNLDPSKTTDEGCPADAPDGTTLECLSYGISRNPTIIAADMKALFDANYNAALDQNQRDVLMNQGFYSIAENGETDVLDEDYKVKTLGLNISQTIQEFLNAQIEKVLGAGTNCTQANGKSIVDNVINPIFQDGLMDVQTTLGGISFEDLKNLESIGEDLLNTLESVGQSLLDALLNGISCELGRKVNETIGPWLDEVLGDIDIDTELDPVIQM